MSLSHTSGPDDQQLARYLLGLLPDPDVERLDEMSIVDDEVAWRLRAVESDLVDAYLAGTLSGDVLERFESVYLASPRRRQKVEFAASFLRVVEAVPADQDAGTETAPEPGTEQDATSLRASGSSRRRRPGSKAAWILSAAAAVLLCASGTLLVRNMQVARELNDAQKDRAALSRPTTQLEEQPRHQQANGEAALSLSPVTRSAGPVAVLTILPGTARVALELRLESNEFQRYHVALRDPATGLVTWRSGNTQPTSSHESPTLSIVVPASVLESQHYSVELVGRRAGGDDEIAASYAFRAVRR